MAEAPHQILVVEDDKLTLTMIADVFDTLAGIKVHQADNVAKALDIIEHIPISLILLDFWNLRGESSLQHDGRFDGKPVLERALAKDALLPVIVMSSWRTEVDIEEVALTNGAVAFLQKPLKMRTLVAQVQSLLHRYEAAKKRFRVTSPSDVRPLSDVEADYVRSVVDLFDRNQSKAAKALGITRQTVANILRSTAD